MRRALAWTVAWTVILLAASCGRLGFDPRGGAPADGDLGDGAPGDGAPGDASLVLWLPFDDDPRDGIDDLAAPSRPAACATTCPLQVPGVRGGAYRFDGTQVVAAPDDAGLRARTGTLALWLRPAQLPGPSDYVIIAGKPHGPALANSYEIYFFGMQQQVLIQAGGDAHGNGSYASAAWTGGTGEWAHVAATWGADLVLYVDGAEVNRQPGFVPAYDDHGFYAGADFNNGVFELAFAGDLDDVRLYDRALPAEEIAALAAP